MFQLEEAIIRPDAGLFTILVRCMVLNSIKHTMNNIYTKHEHCALHYPVSYLLPLCPIYTLLYVTIFHLLALWILTFLLPHYTISYFPLYAYMIMSFRKCKMSTFLHFSYYIFFIIISSLQPIHGVM